jgi:hypothetical protein
MKILQVETPSDLFQICDSRRAGNDFRDLFRQRPAGLENPLPYAGALFLHFFYISLNL